MCKNLKATRTVHEYVAISVEFSEREVATVRTVAKECRVSAIMLVRTYCGNRISSAAAKAIADDMCR